MSTPENLTDEARRVFHSGDNRPEQGNRLFAGPPRIRHIAVFLLCLALVAALGLYLYSTAAALFPQAEKPQAPQEVEAAEEVPPRRGALRLDEPQIESDSSDTSAEQPAAAKATEGSTEAEMRSAVMERVADAVDKVERSLKESAHETANELLAAGDVPAGADAEEVNHALQQTLHDLDMVLREVRTALSKLDPELFARRAQQEKRKQAELLRQATKDERLDSSASR